ncbi:MAG TPA: hypothetical protein DEP84_12615 [Chloroflexi bacterium]|nr:hypothetical protein [Chloroflexota bacterium]
MVPVLPVLTKGSRLRLVPLALSREAGILGTLVLLATAVRVASAVFLPRVIKWDEPDYLRLGYNLLHGQGFTSGLYPEAHYTPLYPLVSGLSYLLVRDWEWASNLPFVIFGAALLVPVYALARRLYGPRTAVFAALLLACFPPLTVSVLYWGTLTEPLYLFLIFSGLWFAWRAIEGAGRRPFAASGLLFGLAYLTRPEGTTYLTLTGLVILALRWPARDRRGTVAGLGLYLATFALVAAPYLIYLRGVTGHWSVTGKLGVTWAIGQAVIDADPAEYDRVTASLDASGREIIWFSPDRFRTSLPELIGADPAGFVRRVLVNARRLVDVFFARTAFSHWLLLLVGVGLFAVPWDRERLRRELFMLGAAAPVLAFLPFHVELRFFSPAFPVLLIWSAHGLERVGQWFVATWQTSFGSSPGARVVRLGPVLPVGVVLLFFLVMSVFAARDGIRATKFGHKEAGLWLRAHAPPDAAIMTRDLAVPLYADRAWVASPRAEWPAFLSYARAHSAGYLVVDEWEIRRVRPFLAGLLDAPPPEVELVWQQPEADEGTRIFRFVH